MKPLSSTIADNAHVVSGSVILAFVEVNPIVHVASHDAGERGVCLSSACAKQQLRHLSHKGKLEIQWDIVGERGDDDNADDSLDDNAVRRGFLVNLEMHDPAGVSTGSLSISFWSENPLEAEPIPCQVVGYAMEKDPSLSHKKRMASHKHVAILAGTLVRVMPALPQRDKQQSAVPTPALPTSYSFLDELVGEVPVSDLPQELKEEIINNHSKGTIQELQLRMSLLLEKPIQIGTTEDSFLQLEHQRRRVLGIATALQRKQKSFDHNQHARVDGFQKSSSRQPNSLPSILKDGALLVHSPDHAAGKTTLVRYIAKEKLGCSSVHVIQPSALLAKYGSQADVGLETTMHSIVMSAAVKNHGSICIILDHLDAMMPPALSASSAAGDSAVPVLHAIASYLKHLVLTLKHHHQYPYPTKNLLYNVAGKGGYIFSVRLCLVAIVTCPDNGWRSSRLDLGRSTGILDALPIGTYRLQSLDAATRTTAFECAFQREGVNLSQPARRQLQSLATAAFWARGRNFKRVARMTKQLMAEGGSTFATGMELEKAFELYSQGKQGNAQLVGMEKGSSGIDPFSTVGGTGDAKQALLDAVALDSKKRELLNSMGLDSPIGVLLYGPPGCGKTLLAKAVASYLGAGSKRLGGAFIALNSSDIVQSAVGESEKLIIDAFVAARENAPSVVFIDEFQALFTERSSSGSTKLSSTLLQCMDDVKRWRKANKTATNELSPSRAVVVLAATNTPWMVDKSFLRPGRFDRIIHVGLPSEGDRESVLRVHIAKMQLKGGTEAVVSICKHVAQKTKGYSGADLAALCHAAAIRALVESCDAVEEHHFLEEIQETPGGSSNSQLVLRNQQWRP